MTRVTPLPPGTVCTSDGDVGDGGEITPFAVVEKSDGTLGVAARDGNLIRVDPLIIYEVGTPDERRRKSLIQSLTNRQIEVETFVHAFKAGDLHRLIGPAMSLLHAIERELQRLGVHVDGDDDGGGGDPAA
jgi:hypothetical protein